MHTKRISIGMAKGLRWAGTAKGPHKNSITIVRVLRDILGYANTSREVRKILREGKVLVDKKIAKDMNFGVGLMDTIEIPETKDHFIVLSGVKGLYLKKVKEQDTKRKLGKVIGKKVLDKGRVQYNLHDGSNVISDKKHKLRDTLILALPSRKITDSIEFTKGCYGMIVSGRHTGKTGIVEDIQAATASRKSLSRVGDIQTLTEYVFAIGKDKPLIEA